MALIRHKPPNNQKGAALIEALIAIIVFSIGIVGLMGIQAASVGAVSDTKIRQEASNVTQQLVGEMWSTLLRKNDGQPDLTYLASAYASPSGSAFVKWRDSAVYTRLPKSNTIPPTVLIANNGEITITVSWQTPTDTSPRRYVLRSRVY
jgi:type IV pilus assembly protein PilV